MKTVFKIIGYEMKSPEGAFLECVTFWIYAKNEKEAMEKMATKGVVCKFYQVTEIIEKYEHVDNTN